MAVETLHRGQIFTLYVLVVRERCLVKEFLSDLDENSFKQITGLIEHIGIIGPPTNEEKFKHLEGKIYEMKTRSGVRILCFFGKGKSLVLTHGFFKMPKKKLRKEIDKALEFYEIYNECIKSWGKRGKSTP